MVLLGPQDWYESYNQYWVSSWSSWSLFSMFAFMSTFLPTANDQPWFFPYLIASLTQFLIFYIFCWLWLTRSPVVPHGLSFHIPFMWHFPVQTVQGEIVIYSANNPYLHLSTALHTGSTINCWLLGSAASLICSGMGRWWGESSNI